MELDIGSMVKKMLLEEENDAGVDLVTTEYTALPNEHKLYVDARNNFVSGITEYLSGDIKEEELTNRHDKYIENLENMPGIINEDRLMLVVDATILFLDLTTKYSENLSSDYQKHFEDFIETAISFVAEQYKQQELDVAFRELSSTINSADKIQELSDFSAKYITKEGSR